MTDPQIFQDHARKFEREFFQDMASLGVKEPDVGPDTIIGNASRVKKRVRKKWLKEKVHWEEDDHYRKETPQRFWAVEGE